ncbi:amino acid dehydrogenase [Bacterioplanes sanyensis]|uniref:Amino acid dehydrogenase n=1 Tax=Bacterioplanes sanyensis TaxID=1249553 RepID=A0A222FLH0_9GAMM|nr:Glu/Leu/Phe/Val dehydrogenase dimerization domain-containing protein [Bacterioplanes sanyensis]ASP39364.1 amino acid dehydrogenase [Bacterioplanes sanyensis]
MFDPIVQHRCEAVHSFAHSPSSNPQAPWRAIVAVHSTQRGPALGGCRFVPYSSDQAALNDAVRLAQGMSRKAALAGLDLGGGKAVIMMPEGVFDRQALFRWFGLCVERLSGEYITAMDAGTQVGDMDDVFKHTRHVASHSQIGDPSPHTARGVFLSMEQVITQILGQSIGSSRIAIQGLGHVGMSLAERLLVAGAQVWVSDLDAERCKVAQQLGATVVAPDQILQQPVDVLAPCALGAIISAETVDALQCQAIVGAANNQLATAQIGAELQQRNIVFAPDYLVNAGGLMFAAGRYHGWSDDRIAEQIEQIPSRLQEIVELSEQRQHPVNVVADALADEAIALGQFSTTQQGLEREALWNL